MRCPQVELYNEEMKDEILVTRRATYKAEESVSMLEKNKGSQDLFIDRLMDQVSFFRSGHSTLTSTLRSTA